VQLRTQVRMTNDKDPQRGECSATPVAPLVRGEGQQQPRVEPSRYWMKNTSLDFASLLALPPPSLYAKIKDNN